ncbi:MAG: preprotein translocase subunit YajC [Mariprofundaceae bacterium]|nr:preprotein translocase subunit YajC [Mariprofundaceae bacterium]
MNNFNPFIYHLVAAAALAMATIKSAHAEAAGAGGGNSFASLVPLVLIMVIFYFLLIRPQQKKLKEHKAMVEATKKGDSVITGGGIIGKVSAVKDDILTVEIAEGVKVKVKRDTIVGAAE